MDEAPITELQTAIEKTWRLEEIQAPATESDELTERLVRRISFMLKHSYHPLLSRLYLMDIRENDLRNALESRGEENKARALADLILIRETEKLKSRIRYLREHSVDANVDAEDPEIE